MSLQLDGYDEQPVVTMDRYRFSPLGAGGRRFGLSSVTDADWEERQRGLLAAVGHRTDRGPVGGGRAGHLRRGIGACVRADSCGRSSEASATSAAIVPYEWSRSVVVYALSDTDFLCTIEDPPGGHPERLDGVAFPVEAEPDQ